MNQDREHLRLLAIFHYVGAGLAALFSLFPLLYTTIGAIFVFAARHPAAAGPKPGEDLPPEFLGWIFAAVGLLLFLVGIAMAICILLAGRCLSRNKHYTFALVMACPCGHCSPRELRKPRVETTPPILRVTRWHRSLEFAETSANTAPTVKIAECDLPPKQLALAHCPPVFGLPMFRCARCSSSALALLTFKAPGSAAPSGTSTQRPPV